MLRKETELNLSYPESEEEIKETMKSELPWWIAVVIMGLLIVFAPQIQSLYIKEVPLDNNTAEGLVHNCYSSVIHIDGDAYNLEEFHELYGPRILLEGTVQCRVLFVGGKRIFDKAKQEGVWGICFDEKGNETYQYAMYKDKTYLYFDGVYYKTIVLSVKGLFKNSLSHIKDGTTYEWVKQLLEKSQ